MKMLLGLVTATCLLLAQPLLAGFPSWYPKEGFSHYGKVDEVTMGNKTIIIEDYEYHFSDSTIVHSMSEKSDSLARLRKGANIGFTFDKSAQGHKLIQEIWLLPENFTQPDDLTHQPHGI